LGVGAICGWEISLAEDADKKSVDVLRVTEILIQWDEVLPYNYTLLLVCDNRYKYSVEIFG
jgi:hypothetical protein